MNNQKIQFNDNTKYDDCEMTGFSTDFSNYSNENNLLPFKLISSNGEITNFNCDITFTTNNNLSINIFYIFKEMYFQKLTETFTITINNNTIEILNEFNILSEADDFNINSLYQLIINSIKKIL